MPEPSEAPRAKQSTSRSPQGPSSEAFHQGILPLGPIIDAKNFAGLILDPDTATADFARTGNEANQRRWDKLDEAQRHRKFTTWTNWTRLGTETMLAMLEAGQSPYNPIDVFNRITAITPLDDGISHHRRLLPLTLGILQGAGNFYAQHQELSPGALLLGDGLGTYAARWAVHMSCQARAMRDRVRENVGGPSETHYKTLLTELEGVVDASAVLMLALQERKCLYPCTQARIDRALQESERIRSREYLKD